MSLNQAQLRAVAHKEGPCMVLAGPGSGKTLTIAKRIEYLITEYKVRPEEILVITFTKYAAAEMRERFRKVMERPGIPVTFGTFHGIYYGILKWAYKLDSGNLLSEGEKFELLRRITARMDWEEVENAKEEKDFLQELAVEIGNVKNNCYEIGTYESLRYGAARFRELYLAYEEEKQRFRKIDFEDMILDCRRLFLQRPDILKKWQERFRYILVDEFQDVNQAQYDVVRMLAAPEDNLFVVGDDDQSVYGFRGAKPGIMMEFRKDYKDAKEILLNVNYRSTAHVVNGALRVISNNQERFDKKITARKGKGGAIHIQEAKDPVEEGEYVLEKIREYCGEGIPYEEMAVLYRTNLDARALAETLAEHQIPFEIKEKPGNLYDHFIGTDIMSYLHLAQGDCERKYFLQVANRPKRYISRESMEGSRVTYESLRNFYCDKGWMMDRIDQLEWDMKMIKDKTPFAAIQYIRKGIGYDDFLREYAVYRKMPEEELLAVLDEIQQNSKAYQTIGEWFAHVRNYKEAMEEKNTRTGSGAGSADRKGVSLLTMHGAKGLEYEVVFIIEGNEGSTPYRKACRKEDLEEERRLFYVAMTRAKEKLIISYVKEKNGKDLSPSRFIEELLVR